MIAGIGFRDGATPLSILDALNRAGAGAVRHLAMPSVKAGHPAVRALIGQGYAVTEIAADLLARTDTPTHSAASRAAHGTGSVAEACALAAAGPGARLAAPRSISGDGMATAALALTGESR